MDWPLWLLLAATIVNAMLVGASLDQVIEQLPARRRMGAVAFPEYTMAADLRHGIFRYEALGACLLFGRWSTARLASSCWRC